MRHVSDNEIWPSKNNDHFSNQVAIEKDNALLMVSNAPPPSLIALEAEWVQTSGQIQKFLSRLLGGRAVEFADWESRERQLREAVLQVLRECREAKHPEWVSPFGLHDLCAKSQKKHSFSSRAPSSPPNGHPPRFQPASPPTPKTDKLILQENRLPFHTDRESPNEKTISGQLSFHSIPLDERERSSKLNDFHETFPLASLLYNSDIHHLPSSSQCHVRRPQAERSVCLKRLTDDTLDITSLCNSSSLRSFSIESMGASYNQPQPQQETSPPRPTKIPTSFCEWNSNSSLSGAGTLTDATPISSSEIAEVFSSGVPFHQSSNATLQRQSSHSSTQSSSHVSMDLTIRRTEVPWDHSVSQSQDSTFSEFQKAETLQRLDEDKDTSSQQISNESLNGVEPSFPFAANTHQTEAICDVVYSDEITDTEKSSSISTAQCSIENDNQAVAEAKDDSSCDPPAATFLPPAVLSDLSRGSARVLRILTGAATQNPSLSSPEVETPQQIRSPCKRMISPSESNPWRELWRPPLIQIASRITVKPSLRRNFSTPTSHDSSSRLAPKITSSCLRSQPRQNIQRLPRTCPGFATTAANSSRVFMRLDDLSVNPLTAWMQNPFDAMEGFYNSFATYH